MSEIPSNPLPTHYRHHDFQVWRTPCLNCDGMKLKRETERVRNPLKSQIFYFYCLNQGQLVVLGLNISSITISIKYNAVRSARLSVS